MKPRPLIAEMRRILGEEAVEAVDPDGQVVEQAIIKALALAADELDVDTSDAKAVAEFIGSVRAVVTKDKSHLQTAIRRWTKSRARDAVKAARAAAAD